MRISQKILYESALKPLERSTENLWRLNGQVSSGKRISSPSDDPLGASRVLDYREVLGRISQYERSVGEARSWLSYTESIINQVEEAMVRSKEIALAQSSATADRASRQNAAEEIRQLFGHLLQMANSRLAGRYIFSGTKTSTGPYTDENGDLEINDGTVDKGYQGNEAQIGLPVDENTFVTINMTGKEVFELSDGTTLFDILKDLNSALENDDQEAIAGQVNLIDEAMEQLRGKIAEIGARSNRVDLSEGRLEDMKLEMEKLLSETEDVDMIKAISDLANQQTLYEAALRSTALISRISLMDFLG